MDSPPYLGLYHTQSAVGSASQGSCFTAVVKSCALAWPSMNKMGEITCWRMLFAEYTVLGPRQKCQIVHTGGSLLPSGSAGHSWSNMNLVGSGTHWTDL